MEEVLQVLNQVSHRAMRRNWWIAYKWIETQEAGAHEPVYMMSGLRPISEAVEAARQFDESWRAYHSCIDPLFGNNETFTV